RTIDAFAPARRRSTAAAFSDQRCPATFKVRLETRYVPAGKMTVPPEPAASRAARMAAVSSVRPSPVAPNAVTSVPVCGADVGAVGIGVGAMVGVGVGATVGAAVGMGVDVDVGAAVRAAVGTGVELKVGAALGGKVGTVVAMALEGTEVAGGDATGAALDGVDVRGAVAGLDVAV